MTAKHREIHLRKVATTIVVGPLEGFVPLESSTSDYSPLPIGLKEAKK